MSKNCIQKQEGNNVPGRPKRRWGNNIKTLSTTILKMVRTTRVEIILPSLDRACLNIRWGQNFEIKEF
jgi:hypothetical protein